MCGSNGELNFTSGTPKDVGPLREDLLWKAQAGLRAGATPYYGPVAANIDPLMLQAANWYSTAMGYGPYKMAPDVRMGTSPTGGINPPKKDKDKDKTKDNSYNPTPGGGVDPGGPAWPPNPDPNDPSNPLPPTPYPNTGMGIQSGFGKIPQMLASGKYGYAPQTGYRGRPRRAK